MTVARSARARTRGQNPLVYNVCLVVGEYTLIRICVGNKLERQQILSYKKLNREQFVYREKMYREQIYWKQTVSDTTCTRKFFVGRSKK